jgi:predicted nuclease of restriction endonuclease-like RecB superfamily
MRGIQGYYFNKSQNSWVWLRSSWEYIFAKWLDRTHHIWKVEETVYKIGNSIYKPDFFIYDNVGTLKRIVEIKGYWDSNSVKAFLLLDEQLKIDVSMITDIKKFIQEGSNYGKELELWKQTRLTSKELGEITNG